MTSPQPTNGGTRNETLLRKFQRDVDRILTERDRDYLHDILKDFHAYKSVEKLVASLKSCLDTPKKMDLLVDIRNILPPSYRGAFDALAPYHQMSKPIRPQNQANSLRKTRSTDSLKSNKSGSFRVVNLLKTSPDSSLGFSIRGGREFGTGVYISTIDENSSACKQGLFVGDQVIECSGIDFESITHSSAVNLLSSMTKVKLVVKSEGRVPGFNEIKSGFSWVDSHGLPIAEDLKNSSDGSDKASSGHHSLEFQPNVNLLNSMDEKRINFTINTDGNRFIGFNLRGGKEYGLGIYISKVDRESVADQAGLQVGDLILDVNGTSFENITHQEAVEFVKSQQHIIMTVKSIGILPAAQLFYSDVSWIYPDGTTANVPEGKKGDMLSVSLPNTSMQDLLRRDSSTQVDSNEYISLSPAYSQSKVGLQAEIPEKELHSSVVSGKTKQDNMLSLSLPNTSMQGTLRRDSSTQVDMNEFIRPLPGHTSRSEIGTQAETLENELYTSIGTYQPNLLCSTPTQTPTRETDERPAQNVQTNHTQSEITQTQEPNPFETLQSASAYVTNETTKTAKLKGGDNESTGSVHERSSNGSGVSGDDVLNRPSDNEDGPANHKRKVKKSKSFLQKQGDKIKAKLSFRKGKPKVRKKAYFPGDKEMMTRVDDRCKKLLDSDEYSVVMKHIKKYKEQEKDVEELVNKLLVILDTPRKAILLRDVRGIIIPYDLGRFDAMTSSSEVEALEFYGDKAPASPDIDVTTVTTKPKKTLVAAVQDSRGNFQLRTMSEAETIKKKREELKKERITFKHQGSSILEREAKKSGEEEVKTLSNASDTAPPSNFEVGPSIQVIDVSRDAPHLSTFGVPSQPQVPELPLVEVTDTSTLNPHTNSNGSFLTIPDRLAVEYRDDDNNNEEQENYFSFHMAKVRTSMGISISGGSGSRMQPEIRIAKVFPGGAAADDGTLQSGWELISIDDETLQGVTHAEAVDVIRRAYNDKSRSVMHIVCKQGHI